MIIFTGFNYAFAFNIVITSLSSPWGDGTRCPHFDGNLVQRQC